MKTHGEHINPDGFFENVEISFVENKEELWVKLSEKLEDKPQFKIKTKVRSITWIKLVAAAVVLLLMGVTLFLKLYTTTIQTEKGKHLSFVLPDGSTIELNAASRLSYHPYWWRFEREVSFEGEAFFEIEKGKGFLVASKNGETKVLGTRFNVYARNSDYKVYCEIGTVKVSSTKSDVEFIVKPGEMAIIDNHKMEGSIKNLNADKILGWKENKFHFISEPLFSVFDELERQYNVSISFEVDNPSVYIYTGSFYKSSSFNTSMDLICKSFDFTFVELGNNAYEVLQKSK